MVIPGCSVYVSVLQYAQYYYVSLHSYYNKNIPLWEMAAQMPITDIEMDVHYQTGRSILQYPLPIMAMDPAAAR